VAAKAAVAANAALKALKPVRLSVAPFKYLLHFPPKVAHKVVDRRCDASTRGSDTWPGVACVVQRFGQKVAHAVCAVLR
jgi:hypothetical protein